MAITDAMPIPKKGAAYLASFPIYDTSGQLVTGAAGLAVNIKAGDNAFTTATNAAAEVGNGWYEVLLTSTEMNEDRVLLVVTSTTTDTTDTPVLILPEEAGDIRVDMTRLSGELEPIDNLVAMTKTAKRGTVDNAAFAPTATELEASDITEATDDHFVGRRILFTSGVLEDSVTTITDYTQSAGGRAHFFYDTTKTGEAPANGDTFVVV